MNFETTIRYLVALLYAFANIFSIRSAISSFQDKNYGTFGFFVTSTILNIFMMARIVFVETL